MEIFIPTKKFGDKRKKPPPALQTPGARKNRKKQRMEYMIHCLWDAEADVWVASNDEIPLTLCAATLDHLMDRVREAVPELVELNGLPQPKYLYFLAEARREVTGS